MRQISGQSCAGERGQKTRPAIEKDTRRENTRKEQKETRGASILVDTELDNSTQQNDAQRSGNIANKFSTKVKLVELIAVPH
jgi:hypothetical protein